METVTSLTTICYGASRGKRQKGWWMPAQVTDVRSTLADLTARERNALYRWYSLAQTAAQISREVGMHEDEFRGLKARVKGTILASLAVRI